MRCTTTKSTPIRKTFRFNNRKGFTGADRFSLALTGILGRRLTYKDLIGTQNAPNGN